MIIFILFIYYIDMSISVKGNNILFEDKIIFTRNKPNLKFFKNNKKKNNIKNNLKNNDNTKKKLPAPLWCINELNGCKCNKKFSNCIEYNLHLEYCLFDKNNIDKEKDVDIQSPEEEFYNLDDETIDIIESYERMTGNKILIQFLLGQIDFNLIDKIKKEYYDDYLLMNDDINNYENENEYNDYYDDYYW